MRLPIAALALAMSAGAQTRIDPARLGENLRRMQPSPGETSLECSVTPIPPALNFSLRIQAGYRVRIPMRQYFGPGHGMVQLIRITPAGGEKQPVYLGYRIRLPNVPKTSVEVELGGGYLLGQGGYDVQWEMVDDSGRICRAQWHIKAILTRAERRAQPTMQPYAVAPFTLVDTARAPRNDAGRTAPRITVLLHAAPMSPRRTHFRVTDRMLLLGSLSALMEQLPAAQLRVVAFNLDKQKEILREDDFQLSMLEQVERAMDSLELDLTDVHTLEHPEGHLDLLASLVNQELRADPPPDAVLFFGPRSHFEDRPPHFAIPESAPLPRFFALQFRPVYRATATVPDAIGNTVSSLKGKVVTIHSPADFVKAIALLKTHR